MRPGRGREGRHGDERRAGRRPRRGEVPGARRHLARLADQGVDPHRHRRRAGVPGARLRRQRQARPETAIPVSRTTPPFDVIPAFQDLATTVNKIDTTQLQKALNTLSADFSGTAPNVKQALTGLSRLSTTIASRDEQLQTLLAHAKGVTGVLAGRDKELQQLLVSTDQVLQVLNARHEVISHLLHNTSALATQLTGLVVDNRSALNPALTHLKTVIDTLNANEASIYRTLQLAGPFVRVFSNTIGNGKWFDTYVDEPRALRRAGAAAPEPARRHRRHHRTPRRQVMQSISKYFKPIAAAVAALLVIVAVVTVITSGSPHKSLTAHFSRATGLYKGSSVRVLGVIVGKVTSIKPEGKTVAVKMSYDAKRRIPANASAFIIPPSLVSDRYVQLGPVYRGGPVMTNNAVIPVARTQAPVELSTLLQSIDDLSVALGPNGANKSGALSRLLTVSAENLQGNGAQINSTIKNVAALVSTLATTTRPTSPAPSTISRHSRTHFSRATAMSAR